MSETECAEIEMTPVSKNSDPSVSPDNLLPPVEPPNGKFLVQLFIVPALIVAVAFTLILVVQGLMGSHATDPKQLIKGLEAASVTQWQQAKEFADLLRDDKHIQIRRDPEIAKELGDLLQRNNLDKNYEDDAITMRKYLCHALGQFQVEEALPALIETSKLNRSKEELDVREAAVWSMALVVEHVVKKDKDWAANQNDLSQTLQMLSSDQESRLRSATTFVLGALGTKDSVDLLRRLRLDPHADTRYNAAQMLALHGDEACIDVLTDMLDPNEKAGVSLELVEEMKPTKRSRIIYNALHSSLVLLEKNPNAKADQLITQMRAIQNADAELRKNAMLQADVISQARVTADKMELLLKASTPQEKP